jgi:predicted O-methyltransferase YrrM
LIGVDANLARQTSRLREICLPFEPEYRGNAAFRRACELGCGPGFGYVEAQALHAVVRHYKPATIVEVGAGVSTYCMAEAVKRNRSESGHGCNQVSIEPYPSSWLQQAPVKLVARPVQEVPFETFEALERNDLLFIDSSHAVKTGSDTNFLILEVLPRLKPGVVVHFHDIFLPYDYPRDALTSFIQAQETALLHAFLIGNRAARILFCLSQLHYECPEPLKMVFPEYRQRPGADGLDAAGFAARGPGGHFPASTYLEILTTMAERRGG